MLPGALGAGAECGVPVGAVRRVAGAASDAEMSRTVIECKVLHRRHGLETTIAQGLERVPLGKTAVLVEYRYDPYR